MTPERKHQISALFHAAREMPAGQRASFVAEACGGDEELRQKVEALLQADVRAGDFLKQPVHAVAEDWFAATSSPEGTAAADSYLPDSPLLGRYRILSRLGAGGMGEVFLAEDTQLDRRVAVKLLPAEFTTDVDRLRRFVREAKAASALNHPNILTIHEIGEVNITGGRLHFIVTEYVRGQTLRERMDAGKMPLDAALDVAVQVAGALSAAHEAGIIHRDIKPENLIIRRDGYVKLLDFGLAKLTEEGTREDERSREEFTTADNTETPSHPRALSTEPGKVMGTAHYMSPEQTRGLPVDVRTDIFSLGVVLYEMIAGQPPFGGVNAIEVMGSILNQEPAPLQPHLAALGPGALEVERIVAKALCKDLAERYQTIDDMRADLRKAKGDSDALAAVSSGKLSAGKFPLYKNRGALLLAAILLPAAIGAGAYYALRSPARAPSRATILPFSSLPGHESDPDFSPDGNQLAFAWDRGEGGQTDIFVKLVGPGTPLRLTSDPANEISPAWSPDGRSIAFIRSGQTGGTLLIIPALGGPERKILTSNNIAGNINWSPDGKWLALTDRPDSTTAPRIVMVSVETGETRTLTNPPAGSFDLRPSFSPDGRQLAFVRNNGKVYLTSVTSGTGGGEKMLNADIVGVITRLTWTADGRELIFDSSHVGNWNLWRLLPSGGKPELLWSARGGYDSPAVARQGNRLAVVEVHYDTDIRRLELPPNGVDIRSEAMTRLITSKVDDDSPQYSPDGKKIAFASSRSGSMEVWVCASDGSNPLQLTHTGGAAAGSARWSPDSRQIVYDSTPETFGDVFMIDAEGGSPRRLTTETSSDILPSWSQDGAWIYFCSDRSGSRQIWKMPSAGGPAVQVTQKGGFEAVEAPDGKTLYYSKGYVHGLWTAPSSGGDERPVPELAEAGYRRSWTMTSDGIYFVAHTGSAPPRPLKFFSFATRRVTQLGMVEKDPLRWVPSLAVSPDGRSLLYAQIEQNTSSIMLVENFR